MSEAQDHLSLTRAAPCTSRRARKYFLSALALLLSVSCRGQTIVAWGANLDHECEVPPGITNATAISAGAFHNLALLSDRTVIAWGDSGLGATSVPVWVTNAIAVAAGGQHSLALRSDGTVIGWGQNIDGQADIPPGATNVIAIAAGRAHSLGLRADGTVIAWGNNDFGQTDVPAYLSNVVAVTAGFDHNLALLSDHSVASWGFGYPPPASATNVISLAAGWMHNLALRADGTLVAWGDNSYGQSSVPTAVTNAIAVAAGYGHSLALLPDGTLSAWGLGYAGITNPPPGLTNVAVIGCGENHQIALINSGPPRWAHTSRSILAHVGGDVLITARADGAYPICYQWYHNSAAHAGSTNLALRLTDLQVTNAGSYTLRASNELGQSLSDPIELIVSETPYFGTPNAPQQNHVVGSSLCLPADAHGNRPLSYQAQLNGDDLVDTGRISGTRQGTVCFNPLTYADSGILTMVVTNSAGFFDGLLANLVVTPIAGWGDNSVGQLAIPPWATNVVAVCGGADHSLALRDDGVVVAWGDNTYGQSYVPASATGVIAVAEGETHSLALKKDGTVVAWGDNSRGQTMVPTNVRNAVAIAGGAGFSQALLSNGSIVAWGVISNQVPGALANLLSISARSCNCLALRADGVAVSWFGRTVYSSVSNAVAVAAGASHNVALRNDGSVVSWGDNHYGQTNVPAAAANVTAIAAGDNTSEALRADGSVVCWGDTLWNQCYVPLDATGVSAIGAGGVHSLAVIGRPSARTISAGGSVLLTSGTLGKGRAAYQWQCNGTNILGATNAALVIDSASWSNSGVYQVVVSNVLGVVMGQPISLTVHTPLQFDRTVLGYSPGNGSMRMRLFGSCGINPIVVYASTNLSDWHPIYTNVPSMGPIDFIDAQSQGRQRRFYRAAEVAVGIPTASPLRFLTASLVGGQLRMEVHGQAGFVYSVQSSSDLHQWTTLTNVAFSGLDLTVSDPAAGSNGRRFYRAVTPPSP
jgi:alpha-tubulin suppressor-like RCC1 family protein